MSLIDMHLLVNGTSTLSVLRFTSNVKYVTRSRSAIVTLEKGDRLSVMSFYSDNIMSGANHQGVSFQGLLLYPD